jgi:histidine ammonia-lyase
MLIGNKKLGIQDLRNFVFADNAVAIDAEALRNADSAFKFLKVFSADKIIYGINTGFGPMAQYRIADEERTQLQYNLIRSHASGSGHPLNEQQSKLILLSRLNTLLLGYSGIDPEALSLMAEMLNLRLYPVIYEHGGVGASGDLVQLSHVALALIGEGEVWMDGAIVNSGDALARHGLKPMKISIREGLAIMNGTSAMTGIGIINLINAQQLVNIAVRVACLINEVLGTYEDHFSQALNESKLHAGQRKVAADMQRCLADSKLIKHRYEHLYNGELTQEVFREKVQEYYSIRCVPQIVGAIYDTIKYAEEVVINELNSANDNPIIDHKGGNVYHGGNFHGDYVSLEMDKVKIAISKLSMLLERQLNYLLNDKLNQKLPPFINSGKLGFNFGMQGMQFTATSTVAENQSLSFPMYLHSIPNNNDNQDIVSMGANAALMASKVIENTYQVAAIQVAAVVHAIEHLGISDQLSSSNKHLYDQLAPLIPLSTEDKPSFVWLRALSNSLKQIDFSA